MKKQADITGVILAGGKSSRMGTDKALLKINGKSFIQHIAEVLQQVFEQVIIISDHADRYRFLRLPVYEDIFRNSGPLGGIHSALVHARTENVFVVSCDMPLLPSQVIRDLINSRVDGDATVISVQDRVQPLCGLYKVRCLSVLEKHLTMGQRSALRFLDDVPTVVIPLEYRREYHALHLLTNVNTPEEYVKCVEQYYS